MTFSDNLYHESGHAILNRFFEETFTMELVTVDEKTSKLHDTQSFGGVKGKYAIPLLNRSKIDHDKAILSFLAGLCVDILVENSRVVDEEFFDPSFWKNKLENELKYEGDRDFVGSTFQYIKNEIALSFNDYAISCLRTLFKILNDDIIWNCITELREALIKKPTLTTSEVEQILSKHGFVEWKSKNKMVIIEERTKLLS